MQIEYSVIYFNRINTYSAKYYNTTKCKFNIIFRLIIIKKKKLNENIDYIFINLLKMVVQSLYSQQRKNSVHTLHTMANRYLTIFSQSIIHQKIKIQSMLAHDIVFRLHGIQIYFYYQI